MGIMTGAAEGAGSFQKTSHTLESDFTLEKGQEDVVCVDLEGEWSESSKIFRHPDFKNENIQYITGEVGEGGDHMNLTFKNLGEETITIPGDKIVIFISEDPNETDPNLTTKVKDESLSNQVQKGGEDDKLRQEKEEREKREKEETEKKQKEEKERKEREEKERKELEAKVQKEKEEKERKEKEEQERKEKEERECKEREEKAKKEKQEKEEREKKAREERERREQEERKAKEEKERKEREETERKEKEEKERKERDERERKEKEE